MEKDLSNKAAIEKLKKLAEDVRICIFSTEGNELDARPMSTIEVDDTGCIWFFTKDNNTVSAEVRKSNAHLYYAHPGSNTYLTVHGDAEMVKDKAKMKELWTPMLKAWFPDGLDEPDITLLKVTPAEARYWDVDAAKLVILYSMVKAAVTGEVSKDMGEHGALKL